MNIHSGRVGLVSNSHDTDVQQAVGKRSELATATRIRGLDGLRGLAALMIFLYHAWGHSGFPKVAVSIVRLPPLDLTTLAGFCGQGVTAFFVISGFLLSLPFWQSLQSGSAVRLGDFFKRRFLRIYPAYFIVVLLLALVYDVKHPLFVRAIHVASHLLLLHNFTEATIYNISAPLWYVATVFQLCVGLPLIFLILRGQLKRGTAPLRLLVGLFVFSGAVGVLFFSAANAVLAHVSLDPRLVVAEGRVLLHSPVMGLAPFCAGIVAGYVRVVLSQAAESRAANSLWWEIAPYLTLLVAPPLTQLTINTIWLWSPTGWPVVPALFAILVLGVSQGRRTWGLAAILDIAPLRLLGKVSYSFYLWHDFVLGTVWDRLLGASSGMLGSNTAKTVCALLITSVVAWLSYQLLELRFGRIVAQLWDRANEQVLGFRSKLENT